MHGPLRIALLVGLLITQPAAAQGSRGVSIDVGSIDVAQPLVGGRDYTLPVIVVRNPGTESARYRMGIGGTGSGLAPDPSWFAFQPPTFELGPAARQEVTIRMTVPEDARPDAYSGLITAQLVGSGSGAQVGAAAAARLTLTVRSGGPVQDMLIAIGDVVTDWMPWSIVLPVAAALVIGGTFAARLLSRRYAFRIERRP